MSSIGWGNMVRRCMVLACCLCLLACRHSAIHDQPMTSSLHMPEQEVLTDLSAQSQLVDPRVDAENEKIHQPVPAPYPAFKVNLHVEQVPVQEVLLGLARESGVNIDIHPGITGVVSLHAVQQSIPTILARMARQVDMRYEWLNGVWTISPDMPLLKTYRLDYVQLSRDTSGFIGAASEINAGNRAASSTSGNPASSTASANTNSSRTAVSSQTRHHLWESVIDNLKTLLLETDKVQAVQRYGLEAEGAPRTSSDAHRDDVAIQEHPEQTMSALATGPTDKSQQRQAYTAWHGARLIANPESGILAVHATQRQHQLIQHFLQSVMQVATRQVLIEATIVEVELSKSFQMGIDWSRMTASAQQRGWMFAQSLGNKPAQFSSSTGSFERNNSKNALGQNNGSSALLLGYLNPLSALGNLAASVTLLEQFGKTRVLSSPKLLVLNNQPAVLKVVDNLVYFTLQSQISQSTGNAASNLQSVTTTANTVPVGLVMAVTAYIDNKQQVNLHVRPTISRVLRYVDDPNPQLGSGSNRIVSSIPEIQVREMESVLHVPSGQIAVLGGLMQEDQRNIYDRVPGLSALPGVGVVFRGQNEAVRKTELVIFMRPTVIQHPDVRHGALKAFAPLLPDAEQTEPAWPETEAVETP